MPKGLLHLPDSQPQPFTVNLTQRRKARKVRHLYLCALAPLRETFLASKAVPRNASQGLGLAFDVRAFETWLQFTADTDGSDRPSCGCYKLGSSPEISYQDAAHASAVSQQHAGAVC